jgi:hypothetical protein
MMETMMGSTTARVMTVTLKPGTADQAAAEWPEHIAKFKGQGLVAGYLLVDRGTGHALSITIWDSAEAQQANAGSAEQAAGRAAMMKYFTAAPSPAVYTVAAAVR